LARVELQLARKALAEAEAKGWKPWDEAKEEL
jgi:hypothetical protein